MKVSLYELEGLDINAALTTESYYLNKVKSDEGLRERLSLSYSNFTRVKYNVVDLNDEDKVDIVCFRSMVRNDYKDFFHEVIDSISSTNLVIVEDYVEVLDVINLEHSRFLSENLHLISLINEKHPIRKACLFIYLCSCLYILKALQKFKFKVFLTFSDMQPVENLIVQYFKNKGVKTVTLQHGLYIDYSEIDTVNKVNYENQVAEYFLAWGECTGSLIKRYKPMTKVRVCGKPRIHMANNHSVNKEFKRDKKFIYVILDQNIYKDQNIQLLDIATKYAQVKSYDIVVKFHPQNIKSEYYALFKQISEEGCLTKASIIIGHTSSLVYECLVQGFKVFVFDTNAPNLPSDESIKFKSYEDLLILDGDSLHHNNYGEFYISDTGSSSRLKYKKFFKELLMDKKNEKV